MIYYRFSNKGRIITTLAFVYSIWVIKTGTADLKTFFLGIGLFVLGLILYPVLMKDSQNELKRRSFWLLFLLEVYN